MSSPVIYLGNGVQTRFDVPGSANKMAFINGAPVTPAATDNVSVTFSPAPVLGARVSIEFWGVLPAVEVAPGIQDSLSGSATDTAPSVRAVNQAILALAQGSSPAVVSDSTVLPVDTAGWGKKMAMRVVDSNLTFTPGTLAEDGLFQFATVGDGVHTATFVGFYALGTLPTSNASGQIILWAVRVIGGRPYLTGRLAGALTSAPAPSPAPSPSPSPAPAPAPSTIMETDFGPGGGNISGYTPNINNAEGNNFIRVGGGGGDIGGDKVLAVSNNFMVYPITSRPNYTVDVTVAFIDPAVTGGVAVWYQDPDNFVLVYFVAGGTFGISKTVGGANVPVSFTGTPSTTAWQPGDHLQVSITSSGALSLAKNGVAISGGTAAVGPQFASNVGFALHPSSGTWYCSHLKAS